MSLEPLVLFRAWRAQLLTARLMSLYSRAGHAATLWKPGDNEASCAFLVTNACLEDVPSEAHVDGCGFYGCYTMAQLQRQLHDAAAQWIVRGAIIGWGKDVRGTRAARVRHARIVCLANDARRFRHGLLRRNLLEHFAKEYKVPLVDEDVMALYAAEFGEMLEAA